MNKLLTLVSLVFIFPLMAGAQSKKENEKDKGKVTVKIVREENGKTTVIDTSFASNDEKAINEFFRSQAGLENDSSGDQSGKNVFEYKYDYGNDDDATVILRKLHPVPPPPPAPPLPPGAGKDVSVFSYHFDTDDFRKEMEDLEHEMEIRFGKDSGFMKKMQKIEIREYPESGKSKRKKNTRKRVIVIEEV